MIAAIVVAAGAGTRFGVSGGKQLAEVSDRPVVAHTLLAFEEAGSVDAVVLVAHPDRVDEFRKIAIDAGADKVVAVVPGGETRQGSVSAGVLALPPDAELVVVHDGARPLVTPATVDAAIAALAGSPETDGVVVGHPVVDTLKRADAAGMVADTPDRSGLWAAQTPQVFRRTVLEGALASASAEGFVGTDDAAVVERAGGRVRMVEGSRDNIKVTRPEDLALVEWVLERRRPSEGC